MTRTSYEGVLGGCHGEADLGIAVPLGVSQERLGSTVGSQREFILLQPNTDTVRGGVARTTLRDHTVKYSRPNPRLGGELWAHGKVAAGEGPEGSHIFATFVRRTSAVAVGNSVTF